MSTLASRKRSASASSSGDTARQYTLYTYVNDRSVKRPCIHRRTHSGKIAPSIQLSSPGYDSVSPSSSFVSLPLTAENLQKLEARTTTPPRSGSRSPVKNSTRSVQGGFKLRCFSVFCGGRNEPLPHNLRVFADDVLLKPQPETPSATKIARRANAAAKMTEPNGKALLRPFLLPKTRMQSDDDDDEAIELIDVSEDSNLDPIFLPEPADAAARQWFNSLEAPRPDHAVGYLRRHLADSRTPRLQSPFTLGEERILAPFDVCKEVIFPHLTVQWKSAYKGGMMEEAERQASRDGAVLVNNMHQLLKAAYPDMDPDLRDTAHVSLVCDMRTIVAWVHWRQVDNEGNVTYEMERLAQSFCNDDNAMQKIRTVVKNARENAVGPRLEMIKRAIEALKEKLESETSTLSEQIVPHLATPSISSTVSDSPARKRPRFEAAIGQGLQ